MLEVGRIWTREELVKFWKWYGTHSGLQKRSWPASVCLCCKSHCKTKTEKQQHYLCTTNFIFYHISTCKIHAYTHYYY